MAELILTQEEKYAKSYLDWSDEAIANAVRFCTKTIWKAEEKKALFAQAAAQILIAMSYEINATNTKITLEGVTMGDKEYGDWVVTAKRVDV